MISPVELQVRGNLLWIIQPTEAVVKLVRQATSYRLRLSDSQGKPIFQWQDLSSYDTQNNVIQTLAGLRHRVQSELERYGFTVTVTRHVKHSLTADLSKLDENDLQELDGRNDQIDVMGLIFSNLEGFIVQAPTGWGKSYLIRKVCKVLPGYRIAIVVPGKDLAISLYRDLRHKIREVGLVGAGSRVISRITVSTMDSVDKLAGTPWDLVLFDEAHRAGAPSIMKNICATFPFSKCVGLSASPNGRSDGADLVVEALFGPILYKVNYEEAVECGVISPIKVKLYQIDIGPCVMSTNRTVVNRHCIWQNNLRNQLIARIARSLPQDDQVLITVATGEHALYLRQELPEFEVVFANVTGRGVLGKLTRGEFKPVVGLRGTELMEGRRERLRVDFEKGTLKRVIATGIWATGVNFVKLKWLIRADGMASAIQAIQTPGRLSRVDEDKLHGTLIDFIDNFVPCLAERSRHRRRVYEERGWEVEVLYDPIVSTELFSTLRKA